MVRNIALLLLSSLLVISNAVAEFPAVRNDNATKTLIPRDGDPGPIGVSSKGELFLADRTSSGTLDMTAASSASITCAGGGTATFYFRRTSETGTLKLQWTNDGSTWNDFGSFMVTELTSQGNPFTSSANTFALAASTNTKTLSVNCANHQSIRALVSVTGTGSLPYNVKVSSQTLPFIWGIYPGTDPGMMGKQEDVPAVSGDVLIGIAGVVNNTGANTASADQDYVAPAMNLKGATKVDADLQFQRSQADGLLKAEDSSVTSAEAGPAPLMQRLDALTSQAANNDYVTLKANVNDALYVQDVGGPANGLTAHSAISAASTNATSVKASAGQLYDVFVCNSNAAVRYLKIYNSASAPTCGSGTPLDRVLVPPTNCSGYTSKVGKVYGTGIGYCVVTGAADTDATAVSANDVMVSIGYK